MRPSDTRQNLQMNAASAICLVVAAGSGPIGEDRLEAGAASDVA
jgi:hypothetical protein